MIGSAAFLAMIERQRPSWSLERGFYTDPEIYAIERDAWLPRQWVLMAHAAELPGRGSYIVRDLFDESIIIVRAGDDDFRAYFNVCTHRGSRICKADGRAPLLVCPYHAWSFKLTGELQSRREVPDDVDPDALGLRALPIRVAEGLILCALPDAGAPDPAPALARLAPALRRHGIANARIAARKHYPTHANWKLVIENAFECYHCHNAHPEYSSANGHVRATGMRDPKKAESWHEEAALWSAAVDPAEPGNTPVNEPGDLRTMAHSVRRQPIGGGRRSLSQDGAPVARLMGDFSEHDGGETQFRIGRLSFVNAANDYVTLVQIQPRGPELTDVTLTWLVDADADAAVDVSRIQWMWDVTTVQDKMLIEDNAAGIRSRGYRPGPYTALESATADFVRIYLDEMRALTTQRA